MARRNPRASLSLVLDSLVQLSARLSGWVLLTIAFLISVTVISRYFFGAPMTYFFEFTEFGIVVITFLASPMLVREDGHIKVDLLVDRFEPRHRVIRWTDWFAGLVVLAVAWYLLYFCAQVAFGDFRSGITTPTYVAPQRWFLTGFMTVGALGIFVESVRRLLHLVGQSHERLDDDASASAS